MDMKAALRDKAILTCNRMLEGAGRIMEASQGTTELVVHPGLGGDQWRDEELKILLGLGAQAIRERFDLISFKDLHPAFKD